MKSIQGVVIRGETRLTLDDLTQALNIERQFVIELVEYEIIQPQGKHTEEWQFDDLCLRRARLARNFYNDLEVNLPGVALALELLERIEALENKTKDK